jgi:EAL domain-containing protein (putative c-di-GMP-specific phosphodiesterase class I)
MKTDLNLPPSRAARRAAVRRALDHGEFVPFYQPIVALATGEITGMEVLARWNHPEHELLPPDRFIHLMEAEKLCGELSRRLLAQVIEQRLGGTAARLARLRAAERAAGRPHARSASHRT